jgi:hypothetical protein
MVQTLGKIARGTRPRHCPIFRRAKGFRVLWVLCCGPEVDRGRTRLRCCVVIFRFCVVVTMAVSGGLPGVLSIRGGGCCCVVIMCRAAVLVPALGGAVSLPVFVSEVRAVAVRSDVVFLKNLVMLDCEEPCFNMLLRAVRTRRSHRLRTEGRLRRS